jgi:hypothetical protein
MSLLCLLGFHKAVTALEERPLKYYNLRIIKYCFRCKRFQQIYSHSRSTEETEEISGEKK